MASSQPTCTLPRSTRVILTQSPLAPGPRKFLDDLVRLSMVEAGRVGAFLGERGDRLREYATDAQIAEALVEAGLMTKYQVERVLTGQTHALVLGSYRVLQQLGSGGMGVVYLAEHRLLKRRAAVKVLPLDDECPYALRERFYAEMKIVAELHHENVVTAYEAGELPPPGPDMPGLIYLVMELVEGGDLEQRVLSHGICSVPEACDFIRQAACGLQATHDRHLVHRDIKPTNLLLTTNLRVKLADFGLARQFCSKLTDPRCLLGSLEFMAPEQSLDPSSVGHPADIYGLGATLFWLLTGEPPYPFSRNVSGALRSLQQEQPRRLRELRPDAPAELEALLDRMLDRNPSRRPAMPLLVINDLMPFLIDAPAARPAAGPVAGAAAVRPSGRTAGRKVLLVDDEASIRHLHRYLLKDLGCEFTEACDAASALEVGTGGAFDLILLDLNLPGSDGYEVCLHLRERAIDPHMKIIVVSGRGDQNELSESLSRGADDYVPKPFEPRQLVAKVEHALRLKAAQDLVTHLTDQLHRTNRQLQQSLSSKGEDITRAHDALLFAMAKMAESREGESPGHLRRLQCYARVLARQSGADPFWAGMVDDRFLEQLERCVPLHDIGKIGLPDYVLNKPGPLSPAERLLMEAHPLIGDRMLEALAREYGASLEFLGTARAIVRHHHERFDGRGYPDRLCGDAIPPAARIVAVADVYDALRRQRVFKAAMSHAEAIETILRRSTGQFDPSLLAALSVCHPEFERIFRDVCDG
jgi:response regulator RpfG family c-di-GMP phosphodiesterase